MASKPTKCKYCGELVRYAKLKRGGAPFPIDLVLLDATVVHKALVTEGREVTYDGMGFASHYLTCGNEKLRSQFYGEEASGIQGSAIEDSEGGILETSGRSDFSKCNEERFNQGKEEKPETKEGEMSRDKVVSMIPKVEASRPGVRLHHIDVNPEVQCIMYVGEEPKAIAEMRFLSRKFEDDKFFPIDKNRLEYGHEVEMKCKKTGERIPLRYFYFVGFEDGEIYYKEIIWKFKRVGIQREMNLGIEYLPLEKFRKLQQVEV